MAMTATATIKTCLKISGIGMYVVIK